MSASTPLSRTPRRRLLPSLLLFLVATLSPRPVSSPLPLLPVSTPSLTVFTLSTLRPVLPVFSVFLFCLPPRPLPPPTRSGPTLTSPTSRRSLTRPERPTPSPSRSALSPSLLPRMLSPSPSPSLPSPRRLLSSRLRLSSLSRRLTLLLRPSLFLTLGWDTRPRSERESSRLLLSPSLPRLTSSSVTTSSRSRFLLRPLLMSRRSFPRLKCECWTRGIFSFSFPVFFSSMFRESWNPYRLNTCVLFFFFTVTVVVMAGRGGYFLVTLGFWVSWLPPWEPDTKTILITKNIH